MCMYPTFLLKSSVVRKVKSHSVLSAKVGSVRVLLVKHPTNCRVFNRQVGQKKSKWLTTKRACVHFPPEVSSYSQHSPLGVNPSFRITKVTLWNRVFRQKRSSRLYGTIKFITVFTRAQHYIYTYLSY
jgi:hypothetical protein